jgi:hypothetical protein
MNVYHHEIAFRELTLDFRLRAHICTEMKSIFIAKQNGCMVDFFNIRHSTKQTFA